MFTNVFAATKVPPSIVLMVEFENMEAGTGAKDRASPSFDMLTPRTKTASGRGEESHWLPSEGCVRGQPRVLPFNERGQRDVKPYSDAAVRF